MTQPHNIRYILRGRNVVKCADLFEWAQWMETADRVIAKNRAGGFLVSTVFLGLDHRFSDKGPPVVFETMTFPLGPNNKPDFRSDNCWRYCTYDDAILGHNRVLYELGANNVTEVEIEDGQIKRKQHHSG